jgi:hypothetical protein
MVQVTLTLEYARVESPVRMQVISLTSCVLTIFDVVSLAIIRGLNHQFTFIKASCVVPEVDGIAK